MPTPIDYRPMMSSSDAIIWNIERDPQLRSTVMSVWLLDKAPLPERMDANIDRMVAAIPRLRQRVVEGRPRPRWEEVEDLQLDEHYVCQPLDGAVTMARAIEFAQDWVHEPFDRSQPLWRLALLTGLPGGKAGVVIKVHHAIADGMGMVLMLAAFTDFERNPAPVLVAPAPPEREVFTPVERVRHKVSAAVRSAIAAPINSTAHAIATLRSAIRLVTPHRTPLSSLMVNRSQTLAMHPRSIAFRTFKTAAETSDVSMNDLFVSVIADAATAYHEQLGHACSTLRVHMPVDIRTGRTATLAGNQFVPARVSLDLRASPGRTRRAHISMQLEALRGEPALGHINTVSAAIQRLGKPISRWIIGGMMKSVDVLTSNVPGPNFPLYLAGGKVIEFYGFGPPAGAALNATLFSYDGMITIGLTLDTAAVSQPEAFMACLDTVIAETFDSPALAAVS